MLIDTVYCDSNDVEVYQIKEEILIASHCGIILDIQQTKDLITYLEKAIEKVKDFTTDKETNNGK